jgi:hypothetical protein
VNANDPTNVTPAGEGVVQPDAVTGAGDARGSDAAHQAEVAKAAASSSDVDAVALQQELDDVNARRAELEAEISAKGGTVTPAVQPVAPVPAVSGAGGGHPAVVTPAPRPTVPPPPPPSLAFDEDAQHVTEHAIGPGSAGLAVRELAQLLETLGFETYISRGENPDNVFTDELMGQVRATVSKHHQSSAEPHEVPQLLRDVAGMGSVHADTWLLLRALADQEAQRA